MIKCCRYCRFCYCPDESDVSGLYCNKNKIIKITDSDKIHKFCFGNYRFSLLKFLFGI